MSTVPFLASTVEPSGMLSPGPSGTQVLEPGRFTQAVPFSVPATTDWFGTGVGVAVGVGVGVGDTVGSGVGVAGGWAIVNVVLDGVLSRLPAASTARTASVCWPAGSGGGEYGEAHASNEPPSMLHSYVLPPLKVNVGVVPLAGPFVIVVSGALPPVAGEP